MPTSMCDCFQRHAPYNELSPHTLSGSDRCRKYTQTDALCFFARPRPNVQVLLVDLAPSRYLEYPEVFDSLGVSTVHEYQLCISRQLD